MTGGACRSLRDSETAAPEFIAIADHIGRMIDVLCNTLERV